MKTNINLSGALQKCRIMRRQGQLSNVQQRRILRSLCRKEGMDLPGDQIRKRWERLMAMRTLLETEIAPKREAHRKTRWDLLQLGSKVYEKLAPKASLPPAEIPPIDPRFDHTWWKEQERLESEQKRIEREAAYA